MISFIILANHPESLPAVLESLRHQTYTYFEVIVAGPEDENLQYMIASVALKQPVRYLRATGNPGEISMLDRALLEAAGSYIICIRGDRVLHPNFIEEHKRLADPDEIVTGSFVTLGPEFTKALLQHDNYPALLGDMSSQRNLKADGAQGAEEGVYVNPRGFRGLFCSFQPARKLDAGNMSFYKRAYEEISEFEADPVPGTLDTFLQKLFLAEGFSLRSARNFAVQYKVKAQTAPVTAQ